MTTTISADNGSVSGSAGLKMSSDSSGVLALQTGANSTAMTLDTSGNVGIGTTTPLYTAASRQTTTINGGTGGAMLSFGISGTGKGSIFQNNSDILNISGYPNAVTFSSGATDVERMRIDSSGAVFINATSAGSFSAGARLSVLGIDGEFASVIRAPTTSTYNVISLDNPNGQVGRIQTSGSATSFLTSSDYRLKENIAPMTGALAKVALLKPVTYKWKVDGTDGQGFIAHELQEVVPDCVGGDKDAVDASGNPQYQGIDTSFLVATLTAALQETKALIDTQAETINALTARIVALEGQ